MHKTDLAALGLNPEEKRSPDGETAAKLGLSMLTSPVFTLLFVKSLFMKRINSCLYKP